MFFIIDDCTCRCSYETTDGTHGSNNNNNNNNNNNKRRREKISMFDRTRKMFTRAAKSFVILHHLD